MSRPRHATSRTLLALLAAAGLGLLAPPAHAQTAAELRRDNDRLKSQVRDLEAELTAARARIADLEQRIADYEKALQGSSRPAKPTAAPPPPPKVTIDESDPAASPRAMLKALQAEYVEATKDHELDTADDRRRRAYARHVRAWAQKTNRRKTPIQWHVHVEPVFDAHGRRNLEFTAVDPVTAAELGAPFRPDVPRTLARRLADLIERGEQTLVIKGILEPRIMVNEMRLEQGPFNNPQFIGPYAEFDYAIEIRAIDLPGEAEGS